MASSLPPRPQPKLSSTGLSVSHSLYMQPWSSTPSAPGTYRKTKIPYKDDANSLQTLNLYYHDPIDMIHTQSAPLPMFPYTYTLESSSKQPNTGLWLIYIHGGAWRDPRRSAVDVEPSLPYLFDNAENESYRAWSGPRKPELIEDIVGIASINYSLSPHPEFPHTSDADAKARSAVHPDHVRDVKHALAFLGKHVGVKKAVLIGHSCGATLAWQMVMGKHVLGYKDDDGTDDLPNESLADRLPIHDGKIVEPIDLKYTPQIASIISIAGLHDLPALYSDNPPSHAAYQDIYRAFLDRTFSVNPTSFLERLTECSPAHVPAGKLDKYWPPAGLRLAVVASSREDPLVAPEQAVAVQQMLWAQGWRGGEDRWKNTLVSVGDEGTLLVWAYTGDHDVAWREGPVLAAVMLAAVKELHGWIREETEKERARYADELSRNVYRAAWGGLD